jgi:hypothetical protein
LNVPEADVSVIDVIFHSRLPHDPTLSADDAAVAADVQLPVASTLATSVGDVGPSCRVSTHAAAPTAIPAVIAAAINRMRVI